ncbi:MAG: amidohydrolase family protein [Dehalococcoidia bacterium]
MVASPEPLAITHITLLDGTGAPPLPDATVLVRDGRIEFAGPSARIDGAGGRTEIDGRRRWLLPGLVDMHVHVDNCGAESLPLWLANGITTIRDIGGNVDAQVALRADLAAGTRVGPRLFTHGPMIDGAPSGFGLAPASGFDRLWTEVDGPAAGAAEVDRLLAAGVDGLKLYQGLPVETLRAMLVRVDGRVPVTGHLTRTRASDAVAAGINCLEHNFVTPYNDICRPEDRTPEGWGWHNPAFIPKVHEGWSRADLNSAPVQTFVESLVASGVYYDPTMTWGTAALALEETEEEGGERYVPPTMRRRREMQAQRMRAAAERPGGPPPAPDPALLRASAERQVEFVGRLIEAGAAVLAGTDTGALQGIPGFTLHRELRWLVRAGMSPKAALETATHRAAEALRRADDQGTIRPGQRADLLVLDADPTADIRNTRRIYRVVKDGEVYDPAALLAQYEQDTAAHGNG